MLKEPQGETREGRGGSQFRGLHTFLPIEVFEELTSFAQSRATVNGSWDYGVAIRELLQTKTYVEMDRSVLEDMDVRIRALGIELEQHMKPKQVRKKTEKVKGLLGQDDEVEEDGKH